MGLNNIGFEVGIALINAKFHEANNEGKIELIEEKMREYLAKKIIESPDCTQSQDDLRELPLTVLVAKLGVLIPSETRNQEIGQVILYTVNLAGEFQKLAPIWFITEKDNVTPEAKYDENGRWDSFITSPKTSYVQAFESAWENLNKVAKTNVKTEPGIQYTKSVQ